MGPGPSDMHPRVQNALGQPVIGHLEGNCHVYVDASADLDMAERVTVNAKVQRPSVCNAAEKLLVHQAIPLEADRAGVAEGDDHRLGSHLLQLDAVLRLGIGCVDVEDGEVHFQLSG